MAFHKDTRQPEWYTMIDVITLNTTVVSNDLGPSQEVHASMLCLIVSALLLGGYFLSCGYSSTVHTICR